MHLMGLPHDFEIDDVKNLNHIAQNVPTCTARDMTNQVCDHLDNRDHRDQVLAFLNGDLQMTEYSYLKQVWLLRNTFFECLL